MVSCYIFFQIWAPIGNNTVYFLPAHAQRAYGGISLGLILLPSHSQKLSQDRSTRLLMCVLTPLFTQDAAIATPRRNESRSRSIAENAASSLKSRAKLGQEAEEFRIANAEEYRDWLVRFCKHRFDEARPDLKARV